MGLQTGAISTLTTVEGKKFISMPLFNSLVELSRDVTQLLVSQDGRQLLVVREVTSQKALCTALIGRPRIVRVHEECCKNISLRYRLSSDAGYSLRDTTHCRKGTWSSYIKIMIAM
jgi:hypothetical protein